MSIHASCCACHFIALDVDGTAWMFGRNAPCALGVAGADFISENTPRRVVATQLGAKEGTKFVHAACGRSHALLADSEGNVWSAGANNFGQVSIRLSSFLRMVVFMCRSTVRSSGDSSNNSVQIYRRTIRERGTATRGEGWCRYHLFHRLDRGRKR